MINKLKKLRPWQWGVVLALLLVIYVFNAFKEKEEYTPHPEPIEYTEVQKDSIWQVAYASNPDSIALSIAAEVERKLPRWVKDQLKNPKSFDKLSVKSWDKGNHVITKMDYNAKNGFGGVVKHNLTVKTLITYSRKMEVLEHY